MSFLSLLLAALLPTAHVKEIPPETFSEEIITIAHARERLIANQGHRIFYRLKGTIIASFPDHSFALFDQTSITWVFCSCDDVYQLGDEIIAVCTAMQYKYENPTLHSEALAISVLRHNAPIESSFFHGSNNRGHPSGVKFKTVEGVVTDVHHDDINPNWAILVLETPNSKALVWTTTKALKNQPLESFLDAEMSITGILIPLQNTFYHSPGARVLASSADAIEFIRVQPKHPFQKTADSPHRQIFTGTVIALWRHDSFFLASDDGRRIRVRSIDSTDRPALGDCVTVSGFVQTSDFGNCLYNSLVRIHRSQHAELENPLDVTASAVLLNAQGERQINTKLNGYTIRLSGTIADRHGLGTPNGELMLTDGDVSFSVLIGSISNVPDVGSRIEVTGACLIEEGIDLDTGTSRPTGLTVALRTPKDLQTLVAPPWWTPARLFLLVALLGCSLVVILVWNAILRKVIARRSHELSKETIRSTSAALRLEERTRLAVELHDTIAQNLTGASFQIKTVARLAANDPEEMRKHLDIVDRTLKSCRDDIRNCIWDLRMNSLDQESLNQSIGIALSPHVGNVDLQIRFNVPREKISETTLHALMRIVRELAINAIRHGKATEVKVAGSIEGEELVFSVRDNGIGFDPERTPGAAQGHFGLQGVRERVRKLNGSLSITSSPGHGSRIAVRLNLNGISNIQQA